jgi:hypothetical protein
MQDLYPTYLQSTKNLSAHEAIIATIIGHCVRTFIQANITVILTIHPVLGCRYVRFHAHIANDAYQTGTSSSGGSLSGFVSQYIGRRLTIVCV